MSQYIAKAQKLVLTFGLFGASWVELYHFKLRNIKNETEKLINIPAHKILCKKQTYERYGNIC